VYMYSIAVERVHEYCIKITVGVRREGLAVLLL
jgi:hypothetical protein